MEAQNHDDSNKLSGERILGIGKQQAAAQSQKSSGLLRRQSAAVQRNFSEVVSRERQLSGQPGATESPATI